MYEGYFEKCKSKRVKHYSSSVLSNPVDMPLVSREEDGKFGYLEKKNKEEKFMYRNMVEGPKYIPI